MKWEKNVTTWNGMIMEMQGITPFLEGKTGKKGERSTPGFEKIVLANARGEIGIKKVFQWSLNPEKSR